MNRNVNGMRSGCFIIVCDVQGEMGLGALNRSQQDLNRSQQNEDYELRIQFHAILRNDYCDFVR